MKILQVTPEEYSRAFAAWPHVFNSVEFSELNASRCDRIHYLLFSDTRLRAGIILGECDGELASPFSAPFGGLTLPRRQHLETIDEVFTALHAYASQLGLTLRITLPPMWHDEAALSQCVSALSRLPGSTGYVDLCYHLPLSSDGVNPLAGAATRARADLRQALAEPFTFTVGGYSPEEVTRAYTIIKANHDSRGFPVRMPLPLMIKTAALMQADTFFLTLPDGRDAAAAIVFLTAPGVAQPIIWGDDVTLHSHHTMYRLCHDIARHYASAGCAVLDLGPSTERSIPNHGLCFFKESLGLTPSLRYTFTIPPLPQP